MLTEVKIGKVGILDKLLCKRTNGTSASLPKGSSLYLGIARGVHSLLEEKVLIWCVW